MGLPQRIDHAGNEASDVVSVPFRARADLEHVPWPSKVIRDKLALDGKRVDATTKLCWGILYELSGYRFDVEFEVSLTYQLAPQMEVDKSQASTSLDTLIDCRLAHKVPYRQGSRQPMRVTMLDPYRELSIARPPDPQHVFAFEAEPDTLASTQAACEGLTTVAKWQPSGNQPDHATVTVAKWQPSPVAPAVARCESSQALMQALCQRLGADRVETWLGSCRFHFVAGASATLFAPSHVHGNTIRRGLPELPVEDRSTDRRDSGGFWCAIKQEAAKLGFPDVVLQVDASLAKSTTVADGCQLATVDPHTVNQKTPSNGESSLSSSFIQSIKDFWFETWGEPLPVVMRAARLYEAIGNPRDVRGASIRAIMALDFGAIDQATLAELVDKHAYEFVEEFHRRVKSCPMAPDVDAWGKPGTFKSLFRGHYKFPWKDHWNAPRVEDKPPKPKPR